MAIWSKRTREIQEYFCCVVVGLLIGFLVSNTYLSVQWRNRLLPCLNQLVVLPHQEIPVPLKQHANNTFRKKLLLICVLTTRRFLDSRALAFYRTINDDPHSDVIFFIGSEKQYGGSLPVVMLDGVSDEEYPPRRKSFAMLEYVNSYHGNHYNWFMRVDDDSYIYLDKIQKLLSRINENKFIYMGHPGLGAPREEGKIGLFGDNPYCMGGTGVLFSRSLLNNVAPRLKSCLNNTASIHEDTELGRCIYRLYALHCTCAKEMEKLFFQNFDREDKSGAWTENGILSKSLTLHPIKNPSFIYKIHIKTLSSSVANLMDRMEKLKHEIKEMTEMINVGKTAALKFHIGSDDWLIQKLNSNKSWSCDHKLTHYSLRLKEWVEPTSRQGRALSFVKARRTLSRYIRSMDVPKPIKLSTLSYRRLVLQHGLQYLLLTKDAHKVIRTFFAYEKFLPLEVTDQHIVYTNFTTHVFSNIPVSPAYERVGNK